MNNLHFRIKQIVFVALYAALFVVLGLHGTINFINFKLTLQNLPLLFGAIVLGPLPGLFIGLIGMFLIQLLTYGIDEMIILWILPYAIIGFTTGCIFKYNIVHVESGLKFWVTIIFIQIGLTLLNTIPIIIYDMNRGVFNYIAIFGYLIFRIMVSVILSIVYAIVIPRLYKMTKKIH